MLARRLAKTRWLVLQGLLAPWALVLPFSSTAHPRMLNAEASHSWPYHQKANFIVQLDPQGAELPNTRFGPITEIGPKIGLSPAQIRRIRKTEGDIWCINKAKKPVIRASAQLLLPTIIATAAHFGERADGTPQYDVSACYFRNKAGDPRVTVKLDEAHAKFYTRDLTKEAGKDLLLIKLDSPIAGAEPFPVDTEEERPLTALGEKVFSVTAHMEGRSEHPEQNIIQQCHTLAHGISDATSLSFDVLDCSGMNEFSGGTIFSVRNDELRVYAILVRSGDDGKNGRPFSVPNSSCSLAIRTNERVLKDAISLSRGVASGGQRAHAQP